MIGHRPLVPEDYFAILKRRWWIVLIPLLILPIITYSLSYTVAPQYVSQTLVLVEGQKVSDGYVRPVLTEDLDSQLATMKEQILSRSRLEPILKNYNLFANTHADMDDRIEMMRHAIDIKPLPAGGGRGLPGFYISFKAGDAHIAQAVCSEITSMFTNSNLQLRSAAAQGTTDFLQSQLNDAKRSLDEQDAKLAAFQAKNMGKLPGEEGSNSNMLSSLNTQLESANQDLTRKEQDRSYLQTLLAQATNTTILPSGVSSPSLAPTAPNPALEAEQTELQTLQAQEADLLLHYTADYPDVVTVRRRIADVRRKMAQQASAPVTSRSSGSASPLPQRESPGVQQLRAQLRSADLGIQDERKQQAQIQASIHAYQDKLESSPAIEEEYKQLTRDYQTAQSFYDDLLSKMNQSKMSTDLELRQEGEHFQVMDAANLPDAPFSPKRSVFLASGAGLGLALGLLVSGLLEYRDTTLRSERDIWAFTNLPTLGMIPISQTPDVLSRTGWRRFTGLFRPRKSKSLVGVNG